ncbi:hypothetical protein AD998_14580 [bacterium 336/3]|nr:hypothetical protein AD998_14580 [bacterium 336/3]
MFKNNSNIFAKKSVGLKIQRGWEGLCVEALNFLDFLILLHQGKRMITLKQLKTKIFIKYTSF